ncbi:plasmid mobilization relaxosome protein MobC [Enterococcus faecalis]|nr:plasmid mobilization relaxosome protein MobC [Enterococcus faecalis]
MQKKYQLRRPIPKMVRFDQEEWEYVKRRIEASPFNNFQNYARILCLTGEIRMIDYSNLHQLNGEVNRIGNNVNQIAKMAHRFDEISEEDVQKLTDVILELKKMISNKFEEELQKERMI